MKGFDLAAAARASMGERLPQTVESVQEIPVELIDANGGNFYSMTGIDDLAANIELLGLLHPIIVKTAEGGRYTLIDGERRFNAVKLLGREKISAIVRRPTSDVFEELMLISANMQQRKMSDADLSKQAERWGELLAELKRSGVEIPGKMRKVVADAFDVSESKIARLSAIRKNLSAPLLERFDNGQLSEAVAYELQKAPGEVQDYFAAQAGSPSAWMVQNITALRENCLGEVYCPETGGTCDHGEMMWAASMGRPTWAACRRSSNPDLCCGECGYRFDCDATCGKCAQNVSAEKNKEDDASMERLKASAEEFAAEKEKARLSWSNIEVLFYRKFGNDYIPGLPNYDDDDYSVERTATRYAFNRQKLSDFALMQSVSDVFDWICDIEDLADWLGCSTDEVLGRSAPRPAAGFAWHDGRRKPPNEGSQVLTYGQGRFAVKTAHEYNDWMRLFPGKYDYWCPLTPPPAVSEMDTEDEEDEDDENNELCD